MKFSDYAGTITSDSSLAKFFIAHWFKPKDKICIVAIKSEKTGKFDVVSQSLDVEDFVNTITDDSLRNLIVDDEGNRYNLYFNVCPVKDDVAFTQRGSESNIDYVPGVWADIDVKSGGFSSENEILSWIDTLKLQPSFVCGSGSGGVHVYWKLDWNEVGYKELILKWWSYLDDSAGERKIDKLSDITRVLRLPGSTRFPKPNEETKPSSVTLLRHSNKTYTVSEIESISLESYAKLETKKRRTQEDDGNRRLNTEYLARELLPFNVDNRWGLFRAITYIEDIVNDNYDWVDILVPHGWTYLRDLRDGSREFARPGRNERSAVVDYEGSPVMSLLSSSEESGLFDLKDSGIHLTKYRVLLRLKYNDDEQALIQDVIQNAKGL